MCAGRVIERRLDDITDAVIIDSRVMAMQYGSFRTLVLINDTIRDRNTTSISR